MSGTIVESAISSVFGDRRPPCYIPDAAPGPIVLLCFSSDSSSLIRYRIVQGAAYLAVVRLGRDSRRKRKQINSLVKQILLAFAAKDDGLRYVVPLDELVEAVDLDIPHSDLGQLMEDDTTNVLHIV